MRRCLSLIPTLALLLGAAVAPVHAQEQPVDSDTTLDEPAAAADDAPTGVEPTVAPTPMPTPTPSPTVAAALTPDQVAAAAQPSIVHR